MFYKITHEGHSMVIDAPCFGVAVDMYLASCGMFGYDQIEVEVSNDTPDIDRLELLKYYPNCEDASEQARIDEWHKHATQRNK